ncbi:MAG: transketolase [Candidatus Aenigmarchaeota archaeon]|nr:transketolase [Candidatus Aenigmarchaeota archaeon]
MDNTGMRSIANLLRRDVLAMTSAAGSGHPTSCMSCAEIMSVLFFSEMSYATHDEPDNDRFILSKGHAAPILYAALYRAGAIKEELSGLRRLRSGLEGHPVPSSLPWAKVATGSLGQGLSAGAGMALAARLQGRNYRTYVLLGDSEMAEGSIYEALQFCSYYKLNNICAVIDVNRLGQRGQTMQGHDVEAYRKTISGLGWKTIVIDGHDVEQLSNAFIEARASPAPVAIVAKTLKGKGVSFIENKDGWHGKALDNEKLALALKELPDVAMPHFTAKTPDKISVTPLKTQSITLPSYALGEQIATRHAYGTALAALAKADPSVIALDAEVSNSTYAEEVKKYSPRQFVECFIAEQNMVSVALGLASCGFKPFASTFASFLSRAHDQIRMAALSSANITFCGSHCGVSIGEDGASQMGLEDIALFRALPGSVVLYPSDATSSAKLTELAYRSPGIKYIRTTRGKTPVLYTPKAAFRVGDFSVLRESKKDKVILAGAGITVHEALKAHEMLKKKKIASAVVDIYSIKPFNAKKFSSFVKKHGSRVVIAEDHRPEGGIGEMLRSAVPCSVAIKALAVNALPHSGKPEELLAKYGIDAKAMAKAAMKFYTLRVYTKPAKKQRL